MLKVTKAQENRSLIAIAKRDHNPPIEIIFAEDHQIDKIYQIIHKTDIADQIVEKISRETITLDQNQIDIVIQT